MHYQINSSHAFKEFIVEVNSTYVALETNSEIQICAKVAVDNRLEI